MQGKDESGPTDLLTGHASRYGFADQHSGVFTKLQVRHNLAIMAQTKWPYLYIMREREQELHNDSCKKAS